MLNSYGAMRMMSVFSTPRAPQKKELAQKIIASEKRFKIALKEEKHKGNFSYLNCKI